MKNLLYISIFFFLCCSNLNKENKDIRNSKISEYKIDYADFQFYYYDESTDLTNYIFMNPKDNMDTMFHGIYKDEYLEGAYEGYKLNFARQQFSNGDAIYYLHQLPHLLLETFIVRKDSIGNEINRDTIYGDFVKFNLQNSDSTLIVIYAVDTADEQNVGVLKESFTYVIDRKRMANTGIIYTSEDSLYVP